MSVKEFVAKTFAGKLEIVPSDMSASFNVLEDVESLLAKPALIQLDKDDITTITSSCSKMLVITAEECGEDKAIRLGQKIASKIPDVFKENMPLAVIFNVTGSSDLTLYEVNDLAGFIYNAAAPDANIIFGAVIDENKKDYVRATVIFGGN
jgi:cell division protein FtsZ